MAASRAGEGVAVALPTAALGEVAGVREGSSGERDCVPEGGSVARARKVPEVEGEPEGSAGEAVGAPRVGVRGADAVAQRVRGGEGVPEGDSAGVAVRGGVGDSAALLEVAPLGAGEALAALLGEAVGSVPVGEGGEVGEDGREGEAGGEAVGERVPPPPAPGVGVALGVP